jgi:hypothetical protein
MMLIRLRKADSAPFDRDRGTRANLYGLTMIRDLDLIRNDAALHRLMTAGPTEANTLPLTIAKGYH